MNYFCEKLMKHNCEKLMKLNLLFTDGWIVHQLAPLGAGGAVELCARSPL